ncbi:probable glycoprotein hormone G-protein coupled receptor [Montipora foliosa]|uniref:probable glycoprotein hormone G-protein coupled receptor n=1 Tax=Montipora foliosa TaxID=591990 RepID=UPI0035F140EB
MCMDILSLTLLILVKLVAPSLSTSPPENCVSPMCSCSSDPVYNVTATCHTTDLKNDLRSYIKRPKLIGAFTVIDDKTTIIPKETFIQFTNLKYLEIRIQYLKVWRGDLSREVPSLEALSFETRSLFILPVHVLQSPKLQRITGLTWTKACINCTLVKNDTHNNVTHLKRGAYYMYPPLRCRGSRYVVHNVSRTIAAHGFLPTCLLESQQCFSSQITVTPMHRCWKSANSVLFVEFFFAPLILLFNFIVFSTTITNKSLKKIPAMLLVSNLAISDFFLGVYSLAITSFRHALSYHVFSSAMDQLCPLLGFLWCFGQFIAASSSFLLTTERYVAIIFAMRPNAKFTFKACLLSIIMSWTIAVLMASLPFFHIGTYTTTTFCLPIQPAKEIPYSFAYSASLVAIGAVIYLITLPMYLHIFLHVRRSGNQMGIKRDGKLAKKISVLVVSNMMFFLLPIFIGLVWLFTRAFDNIPLTTREILVGSFTTVCFSINSFINPLLYAFRDRRFRFVIRQRYRKVFHPNSSVSEQPFRKWKKTTVLQSSC